MHTSEHMCTLLSTLLSTCQLVCPSSIPRSQSMQWTLIAMPMHSHLSHSDLSYLDLAAWELAASRALQAVEHDGVHRRTPDKTHICACVVVTGQGGDGTGACGWWSTRASYGDTCFVCHSSHLDDAGKAKCAAIIAMALAPFAFFTVFTSPDTPSTSITIPGWARADNAGRYIAGRTCSTRWWCCYIAGRTPTGR